MAANSFRINSYNFGVSDFWIQAVIVGIKM
jgi:hypothetical protein